MHGGRTSVLLHRSRTFSVEGGVPVDILTFDNFRDYGEIRGALREQGKLVDGVNLRNLWEELPDIGAGWSRPVASRDGDFHPLVSSAETTVEQSVGGRSQIRRTADGGRKIIRTDHLRPDGTLFLADVSAEDPDTSGGKRRMILCNQAGEPVAEWRSSWQLYRFWLDYLADGVRSHFIVDNKHVGTFMAGYSRSHASVIYQVHDSHLSNAALGPTTPLSGAGNVLIPRIDAFDGVVVLTHRQADDIRKRVADTGNIHVIPNSRSSHPRDTATQERARNSAVLLAQLRPVKQIQQAIQAVHIARRQFNVPVTLDIYGEGTEKYNLENVIAGRNLSEYVALKGHTHDTPAAYASSSFSLLTSSSESFGLVIVESMAAGCIPIVYDIHYGPESIINHGVDGFIVEYGNEQALAETIVEFCRLPEDRVSEMRAAAISRAADFSDEAVLTQWGSVLEAVWKRKGFVAKDFTLELLNASSAMWTTGVIQLDTELRLSENAWAGNDAVPRFLCRLSERGTEEYFRADADRLTRKNQDVVSVSFSFKDIASRLRLQTVWDFVIEVYVGAAVRRVRVRADLKQLDAQFYSTVHGNLSIRSGLPEPASAIPSVASRRIE